MIKLEMGERSRESAQKRETPRVIADAMHREGVARPLTFSWSGCSITRTEPCTTGCQHHTSVNSESKQSDARDVHSQGVFKVFDKSLAPVQWVSQYCRSEVAQLGKTLTLLSTSWVRRIVFAQEFAPSAGGEALKTVVKKRQDFGSTEGCAQKDSVE